MNTITSPITPSTRGQQVVDLQDALAAFLERGVLLASDEGARRELLAALRKERNSQAYGNATSKLVSIFQEERRLRATGEVDAATANAINALLDQLGLLDQPTASTPTTLSFVVSGQVRREDGRPLAGAHVRAAHEGSATRAGVQSVRLGEDTTDTEGRYTIRYEPLPGSAQINLRIAVLDADGAPLHASDLLQGAKPLEIVDLIVPSTEIETYHVAGRVESPASASVGGLRVVIIDKGVGGYTQLAAAITAADGRYEVSFSDAAVRARGKTRPDLQARVFAANGRTPLGGSDVRYDASTRETLNVLLQEAAAGALPSEYETLMGALAKQFKGKLADLKETDEQQDITYLANKTGWDARAVALAALADQFSARTANADGTAAVPQPFFYALFRAGVPANETALYRTDPQSVERIWKRALEQNVIPSALRDHVPEALQGLQKLASRQLLEAPALAGMSSFKEILALSVKDAKQQTRIADLYVRHGNAPESFWKALRGVVGDAAAERLRIDGQLAYLTLNNAPLIGKLHTAAGRNGLADPKQLVAQGFYRAAKWRELLGNDPVPKEIRGTSDDERRELYAELVTTLVRLSYPTAVVAEMVRNGETPAGSADLRKRIHTFLSDHDGKFEIGMQPVAQYVARHELRVPADVVREIARIQRVYQITPSDESMNGLLAQNIDSAYAVVRYDGDEFVRSFANVVGGEHNARLIHAKAQQVHGTVLNVALTYLTAQTAPLLGTQAGGSLIPGPVQPTSGGTGDALAYATLENLLGEMDYCSCDHCRSVLSPAAYLVDLLLFLDRPSSEVPLGYSNPLTVLLERRPDIQHLPLTCENTNTPLPYIDIVNEALEHYVVNGLSLAAFTGHDTDGSATPEALLASPQFVSDAAYTALRDASFPPPLPFHQPLESLRRYFERFQAPLPEVMETLRKSEQLERASASGYGWRDIWIETLRLSRAEHRLLTERSTADGATDVMLTLKQLYGFDAATPNDTVRATLENAKSFCRRIGITYEQLAEILRTRFVNPSSQLLPKLERLGVSFATLKAVKDGTISDTDFDALLSPGVDPAQYGGDIKAWVRNDDNYARVMSLITLTDPTHPDRLGSFDTVELRYSNPDNGANRLRPFDLVRLARFIRLWKKLGWSIAQTDKTITALYPAAQTPDDASDAVNLERLDAGFLDLLPRLGIAVRVMSLLDLSVKKDLLPLLACFSTIDTHGESSLYRQMFLSPSRLDEAFADDGYGNYLGDSTQRLLDHAETLRAALSLTDSELGAITTALGYDAATPLTLENVSAVFRRGWLARKLKLSVQELLLLTKLAGYDPFEVTDPTAPAIVRFVELVTRLRALGLKPVQPLYLVWNQDLSGKSAPAEADLNELARTVRSALRAIADELAVVDDPEGSIARARMALVCGNDTADLFFGLLENTFVTAITYSHAAAALEQPILDAAPGRLAYDDFRKQLSYGGVLTAAARDALKAVAGVTQAFRDAVDALYAENARVVEPFFERYPELQPLYDAYASSTASVEEKRAALLAAFVPELVHRRKRQQALQSVSAAATVELRTAIALLEDASVLHATDDASRPALDDITAIDTAGLAAAYFHGASATGSPDLRRDAEATLAYSPSAHALPPNGTTAGAPISGIWSGYLEAPENGFYNIRIDTDTAATVTLRLDGATIALAQNGGSWSNSDPIDLRAGALYAISITVENVKDALSVRWQTAGRGWEVIPARYLYSATLVAKLRSAYIRFLKAAALGEALKLTATELAHFAAHADYRIGGEGWMNHLPVTGRPDDATAAALFEAFAGMLEFSRIKAEVSPDDERLLEVVRDPAAATADAESSLYVLTRWEPSSLAAVLTHFGYVPADLAHVEALHRVHDAFAAATKLGISAAALIEATTNEPSANVVQRLQAALRARYEDSAWLEVLKPINDEMRALQRDALVAFILHRMRSTPSLAHIDTPEKLFEHFLMDVQMEPTVLTSRIRHALSSVQLFVERCLMSLEPSVSPSSIKAKQWEWMKRYRVWEANRKVFLWSENWLEPELRDDQSPIFKETMSELLQGDITEDRAAQALIGYLTKLEEVAKLEICAVRYERNSNDTLDDVIHVIGRTTGASRKYYYRRRELGCWTPWEKVTADIDDNPVLPVVWRNRLFLFWLKVMLEPSPSPLPAAPSGTLANASASSLVPRQEPKVTVKLVLCWSEHVDGKWQPARTSDSANPLLLCYPGGTTPREYRASGIGAFDRSRLVLSAYLWTNGLRIIVSDDLGVGFGASFFLYNSYGTPELRAAKQAHFSVRRRLSTGSSVKVTYPEKNLTHTLLSHDLTSRGVQPHHSHAGNPWEAPFFLEDARHVFYVTTEQHVTALPGWADIGIVAQPEIPSLDIPALARDWDRKLSVPIAQARQPGFGIVDPAPFERYVTEDVHIGTVLATPGTVTFDDKHIGVTGSQLGANRRR